MIGNYLFILMNINFLQEKTEGPLLHYSIIIKYHIANLSYETWKPIHEARIMIGNYPFIRMNINFLQKKKRKKKTQRGPLC